MTITKFRAAEPLYIVILRNNDHAENQLRTWIKNNQIEHAVVAGNRMMLHCQQSFDHFIISWMHNLDDVTVWDTWNRRHIYL